MRMGKPSAAVRCSMKAFRPMLLFIIGFGGEIWSAISSEGSRLSIKQAEMLVLNTPEALRSKDGGRCPKAELLSTSETAGWFQVRSTCKVTGSGLLGNYEVDLTTGEVWVGDERIEKVVSKRLNLLRKQMIKSK